MFESLCVSRYFWIILGAAFVAAVVSLRQPVRELRSHLDRLDRRGKPVGR